jgi:hypothetical protein
MAVSACERGGGPATPSDRAVQGCRRARPPKGITCRSCTTLSSGAKFKVVQKSNHDNWLNVHGTCVRVFGWPVGALLSIDGGIL